MKILQLLTKQNLFENSKNFKNLNYFKTISINSKLNFLN